MLSAKGELRQAQGDTNSALFAALGGSARQPCSLLSILSYKASRLETSLCVLQNRT